MRFLFSILLAASFAAREASATIASSTAWECRATATSGNVNGGGFNSARGGTDYTLQDAAQLHNTDFATSGAGVTTLTSVTGGFTSAMVGNVIHIVSGTGFTAGWYEITAFTDANTVTLDSSPSPGGAGSGGSGYVGGAMSLGSTLDDAFFEALIGGNTCWIKAGTFTFGQVVSVASASATPTANVKVIGYNASRGDNPTGTSRPIINMGANSLTTAANWTVKHLRITESGSGALHAVSTGADVFFENVYILNASTASAKSAINCGSAGVFFNCEAISQNGVAVNAGSQSFFIGCYLHDSDTGITGGATAGFFACVVEGCKTAGFASAASTTRDVLVNCTIYGSEGKVGTGVSTSASTATGLRVINTIFYGLTTGISIGTAQQDGTTENYNCFRNNTTDRSNIAAGANSVTTNPSFTGATQITGSTATTTGSTLTQGGGDFSTVTDNVDFVRVTSGTGVTTGIYLITAHTGTTLTTNNALGTSSAGNVVYTVSTGHNFLPTGAL